MCSKRDEEDANDNAYVISFRRASSYECVCECRIIEENHKNRIYDERRSRVTAKTRRKTPNSVL